MMLQLEELPGKIEKKVQNRIKRILHKPPAQSARKTGLF
jgi:hypothetical protein